MKILILGSEGFIGGNLIAFYLDMGWSVFGIDRFDTPTKEYEYLKVLSTSDIIQVLDKHDFQFVVNAAGSGNVGFSIGNPLGDFESNCFETIKILEALRLTNKGVRYLHISSAAVYGNPDRLPIGEDDNKHPLSPYGWHKLMSEFLCKEYFENYGVKTCIARPFSVFGPGLRKQLFWDLYHKAKGKSSVELFGSGKESRDFIYITDLVSAFDTILHNSPMQSECYNVAGGNENSIEEVAEILLCNFSVSPLLTFNGIEKVGDPKNWKANISRLTSLGFKPAVSLEEGIANTFQWMQSC